MTVFSAFLFCSVFSSSAEAQDLTAGLRLYQERDLPSAALVFHEVLSNDTSPKRRSQAQIYLADSLRRLHFLIPSLFYYHDMVARGGPKSRFYAPAIDGLLRVHQELHDPIFVPSILDRLFNARAFSQLPAHAVHRINFLVGELSFRQRRNREARDFLSAVPPESRFYAKARYLMGLLAVRQKDPATALDHFTFIQRQSSPADPNADDDLKALATLSAARVSYGEGRYSTATEYYGQVPRGSEFFFNAVYESAWSHFQAGEYGLALGKAQSAASPFFDKRLVPEAYVVAATTYFVNCQWDRVRRAVQQYQADYEPLLPQLKTYLKNRDPTEGFADIMQPQRVGLHENIARDVRKLKRFKDFYHVVERMKWESASSQEETRWKGSRLARDMKEIIADRRKELEPAIGRWVHQQLAQRLLPSLQTFQNQIDILDFEVTDAERQWLEQGQEILKKRRARLPRPEIPDDQWQHWSFQREVWRDELGFVQHTIASECLSQI